MTEARGQGRSRYPWGSCCPRAHRLVALRGTRHVRVANAKPMLILPRFIFPCLMPLRGRASSGTRPLRWMSTSGVCVIRCSRSAMPAVTRANMSSHYYCRSKQREGPFGWGPLFGNVIIVGTASSSVPLATIPRSPAISVTLAFRLRTVHAPFTTLHGVARSVWLLRSSLRAANQLHPFSSPRLPSDPRLHGASDVRAFAELPLPRQLFPKEVVFTRLSLAHEGSSCMRTRCLWATISRAVEPSRACR